MSLFQKIYKNAVAKSALVKGLSASVKLIDESGSVSMSAKDVVGGLEAETPQAVAKLMQSSDSVKVGRKMKFEKSNASVGFTINGKLASEEFLAHEGIVPEVPAPPVAG